MRRETFINNRFVHQKFSINPSYLSDGPRTLQHFCNFHDKRNNIFSKSNMSANKEVTTFGFLVLLFVARCSSQTAQPAVSPLPAVSSTTPLPQSAASPYFNAFRPIYPQQYVGGPNVPPQYIGGPVPPQFIGGPVPPQFIGAPNVPQRVIGGPNPYATPFVPILQQTFDITPEGAYTFSFQSADGTQRQESGGLKYPSAPGFPPVMSVQGSYSAITPEGIPIEVTYTADENGYQPSGPGIHPAIQRAVAQQVALAKQEQQPQPPIVK